MLSTGLKKRNVSNAPSCKNLVSAILLSCVVSISYNYKINYSQNSSGNNHAGPQLELLNSKAKKASYDLFDDITDLMWEWLWRRYKSSSLYLHPDNPLKGVKEEEKWLSNHPRANFYCPQIDRVGSGEEVTHICYSDRVVRKKDEPDRIKFDKTGDIESPCLIYSIGCAEDFSFEYALFEKYNREWRVILNHHV